MPLAPPPGSKQTANKPLLTVSSQQSRYAVDAVDAPNGKDLFIKDLSVSVGQNELISRTNVHFEENHKYVLVGRNGEGKSTLLRAFAEKAIPGVPWNMRMLLLGQSEDVEAPNTPEDRVDGLVAGITGLEIGRSKEAEMNKDETVLEHVLRADRERERLRQEADILTAAVEISTDPIKPVLAYRQIVRQRLKTKLHEAHLMAERRSGARGSKARQFMLGVEAEIVAADDALKEDLTRISAEVLSRETKAAVDMLSDVQTSLEMVDANAAESRARTVLLGLGFPLEKIDDFMSKLSGGWRTRCELASALCQKVDILFLDEPTNFLDLPSVIWLQDYINGPALEDTTVVTVTHDRDFADAVAQELLILRHKKIERFKGNLSTYEREKMKKIKYLTAMSEAKDKQKAHIEQSIKHNIQAAKKSGDDKKLKQAAMKQKKLDDRWGMEVSAKGGRWKLNRDNAGYGLTKRAQIEIPDFDAIPRINLPMMPPDLRFPGALVNLEKVSFAYGKKGPVVVNEVDLTIYQGNRIGLCGLNGSGKTTLVSLIDGTVNATKGTIARHARVQIARFSQLSVEELDSVCVATPNITALQHLLDHAAGKLEEKDAWAILGSLGLSTASINSIPLMALSGGQKVRLALAKKVYTAPHLLILDEVTTHLDGETILALIFAIKEFEGALLVITHDRFFMRCVIEGENPAKISSRAALENMDEEDQGDNDDDKEDDPKKGIVYRMFKGGLRVLENGMEQYEDICTRTAAKLTQKSRT